jgi:hypothetical protein
MVSNFTEAVGSAVRDATCGILSANENLAGFWARNTNLPFTDTLANAASGFRRGLCSDNTSPPVPGNNSPFMGGQCPGTLYRVRRTTSQGPSESLSNGPISGLRFQLCSVADCGPGAPPTNYRVFFFTGDSPPGGTTLASNVPPEDLGDFSIDVLEAVSGPDDCGDPAPDPAPPVIIPVQPINITYVNNEGDMVTELGDLNLSVPIFLPGAITIPFTLDVGGVNINGSIDVNGDITFEFGGGRQPDDTDTDVDPPVLPPGTDPDDSETERRIVGVHVFTNLPPNTPTTVINQNGVPNIFAPRGGSVRFLILGGGGSSWTDDIDIKGARQYIPCPAPQGAINVIANPLPGGTVSTIRVYGSIPSYLIP